MGAGAGFAGARWTTGQTLARVEPVGRTRICRICTGAAGGGESFNTAQLGNWNSIDPLDNISHVISRFLRSIQFRVPGVLPWQHRNSTLSCATMMNLVSTPALLGH